MQPSETSQPPLPDALLPALQAPKAKALKQELVAPHEWASMLTNIESEHSDETHLGEIVGDVELFSDDLWERLSSTRWIKRQHEDIHNSSTVANRPTDVKR